jgi:hypothetical protein
LKDLYGINFVSWEVISEDKIFLIISSVRSLENLSIFFILLKSLGFAWILFLSLSLFSSSGFFSSSFFSLFIGSFSSSLI